MSRTRLVGGLACCALVLSAAPAVGAVTIGSNLDSTPLAALSGTSTVANASLPPANRAAAGLFAPQAGVVVAWAVRASGASTGTMRLRILAGNTASGASATIPAPGGPGIATYPARLAIPAGGRVGLDATTGDSVLPVMGQPAGAAFDFWTPPLGDTESRPPNAPDSYELLLQATIEPDGDGDVFGDETQDGCPGVAGPRGGCPDPPAAPDPPGAPETAIDSGPAGRITKPKATFAFSSPSAGATFECALDGAGFSDCASPKKLKKLRNGKHTFRVRAISAEGLLDRTAAEAAFKVKISSN